MRLSKRLSVFRLACCIGCILFLWTQLRSLRKLSSTSNDEIYGRNRNNKDDDDEDSHHRSNVINHGLPSESEASPWSISEAAADAIIVDAAAIDAAADIELPSSILTETTTITTAKKTTETTAATKTKENSLLGTEDASSSSSSSSSSFVVDILSIGSKSRLDYVKAQSETFASHSSVRNFFYVTEEDDDDPLCTSKLTREDVLEISHFCKSKKIWNPTRQFLMHYLQGPYANAHWLEKKKNPMGWLCAQTRPVQGLYNVMKRYLSSDSATTTTTIATTTNSKQQQTELTSNNKVIDAIKSILPISKKKQQKDDDIQKQTLPDYLIIMDDDTYYNMELFQQYFQNSKKYSNSLIPTATAGCMVRSPLNDINWTIPFGGYGFILSKGYLERLSTPIICKNNRALCRTIRSKSHLDERTIFTEGMTTMDLMYKYAINQPFAEYKNWTTGFCLHSDWYFAYFTNFYNLSRHVSDPIYSNVPQSRMEAYMKSELYAGDPNQGGRRICDFQYGNCNSLAHVCHYSTPERMTILTDKVKRRFPHKFINNSDNNNTTAIAKRATTNTIDDTMMNVTTTTTTTTTTINNNMKNETQNITITNSSSSSSIVVDIISIGSKSRLEYQQAQKETFGSHPSVRNFFPITEDDDHDPLCSVDITTNDVTNIMNWCRAQKNKNMMNAGRGGNDESLSSSSLMEKLTMKVPKTDTVSWLCSQTRSIHGFVNILRQYNTTKQELPDVLLIIQDDTYYNMHVFEEMFLMSPAGRYNLSSNIGPLAMTGCLHDYEYLQFTFPSIKFGLHLSRGVLENMIRPIYCHHDIQSSSNNNNDIDGSSHHDQNATFCGSLEQVNAIRERSLFHDGMNLIDLMDAYVTYQPYRNYKSWTSGYCLENEWFWGYMLNYYTVSRSVMTAKTSSNKKSNRRRHIEPYIGSKKRTHVSKEMCRYTGLSQCHPEASFCHKISPTYMKKYYYTHYNNKTKPTN